MEEKFENITLREALQEAFSFAKSHKADSDGIKWLLKEQLNYNNMQLLLNYNKTLTTSDYKTFKENIEAYIKGLPPQYIIGYEWFYDRKFKVNPAVLIPRPETEELVEFYLKFTDDQPKKVLDIGTGSGAIAITAKLERPHDEVWAVDISSEALEVAKENAKTLSADVTFVESNLFQALENQSFDVILSNPPYVSKEEWDEVDDSVKQHEPETALIAEDNGLAIYKEMVQAMPNHLNPLGVSFMEFGYKQGKAIQEIFQTVFPNYNVDILKDMSGHDRIMYMRPKR